jgi:hypothetical protein
MTLEPRHLGRRAPPYAWEAYFFIGIFPEGGELAWCKAHFFSGGARPDRHCLSAAEALDGPGERAVILATPARIVHDARPLAAADFARAAGAWNVEAPGVRYRGTFPDFELDIAQPELRAAVRATDVLWWVRLPRVLSYFGAFGEARLGGQRGLGIVEHAWGADTRFDVLRWSPRSWHWDVLRADDGAWWAGLAIGLLGRLRGVRAGGRGPEGAFAEGRRLQVKVRERALAEGRSVPRRWEGTLSLGTGTLRYEARAGTPVATTVPDGGFLGTTFEGEWAPRGGSPRAVRGTGFTEYRAAAPPPTA